MTEVMPWLVTMFLALVAALVGLGTFLVRRLSPSRQWDLPQMSRLLEAQESLEQSIRPLVTATPPPTNVITNLTFAESLNVEQFANRSEEASLSHLNALLRSANIGDGIAITINAVRLGQMGPEMIVSASKEGQKLLAEGQVHFTRSTENGRLLPQLRNAKGIKENLQEVPFAKMVSRLGVISTAVVGAAHIISGADIAKRLALIDKKVDLLLACRRIDQMARLERVYTSARELLVGAVNRDVRRELWRLRGELRELRAVWRLEFQHHLNSIEDPAAVSWLKRIFTSQKTIDRSIHSQVTEGQIQLALIDYSFRLDQAIAVAGGTLPQFDLSLRGELQQLEEVSQLLRSKASYISGRYPDMSVQPTLNGLTAMVDGYRELLRDSVATVVGGAILAQ